MRFEFEDHAHVVDLRKVVEPLAAPNDPEMERVGVAPLRDEKVERAIALDVQGDSVRSLVWKGYKAKRKERAPILYELLEETASILRSCGYHTFRSPATQWGFFEADDVIASMVSWAKPRKIAVDMYSGDSDLAALVSDEHRVRMLRRYRGITSLNERGVEAWQGVRPARILALKALAGDQSDDYSDLFPGIGKERAIRLLAAAGNDVFRAVELALEPSSKGTEVQAFRRAIDEIAPNAIGLEARKHAARERVAIGLALAGLRTDVPLEFDAILERRTVARTAPPAIKVPASTSSTSSSSSNASTKATAFVSVHRPGTAAFVREAFRRGLIPGSMKPGEYLDDMNAQSMAAMVISHGKFSPPNPHKCPGCCNLPETATPNERALFDRWWIIERKWIARGEPSACPVLYGAEP
jgi:5'-3' exonuclease